MKRHLRVVGAIFIENGKLLGARRGDNKDKSVAHKLEFIGGKVEGGESDEVALKRELFEETGAIVSVGDFFMRATHEYDESVVTIYTYFCSPQTALEPKEHEEFVYLGKDDINFDDWAPADITILKELKNFLK